MRRSLLPTLAGLLAALPAAALAQDGADDGWGAPAARDAWSFAIGAGTDNRSKGASKTDGDPFAYALAEWAPSDTFYVSGEVERVDSHGADAELGLAIGVRPQAAGFDLDLSVARKHLIDAAPGADDGAWELTAVARRSLGPASARLTAAWSPDGLGPTDDWTWIEGQLGWDLTPRLNASAAVGRREQDGGVDYTAWNIGTTFALTRDLELDVRWYDTSERDLSVQYDSALVAAVNFYF